jgi:hypothetical protein
MKPENWKVEACEKNPIEQNVHGTAKTISRDTAPSAWSKTKEKNLWCTNLDRKNIHRAGKQSHRRWGNPSVRTARIWRTKNAWAQAANENRRIEEDKSMSRDPMLSAVKKIQAWNQDKGVARVKQSLGGIPHAEKEQLRLKRTGPLNRWRTKQGAPAKNEADRSCAPEQHRGTRGWENQKTE